MTTGSAQIFWEDLWQLKAESKTNVQNKKQYQNKYIRKYLPISSVGFFSMKLSQRLMNDAVVSFEGHSPWL